jgi:hypothetical protein
VIQNLYKLKVEKYYIIFIDDFTRYGYTYLLRSNDEALEMFKHYKNEVQNQLKKKINVIKSDKYGEYKALFGEFCFQNDIINQITPPYLPQ